MVELRHLRTLREIAKTGSYSAAARALGYTQPAVSQQIRALETAVGTSLVTRSGRTMRLTEAGSALCRRAGAILASVAMAEEDMDEDDAQDDFDAGTTDDDEITDTDDTALRP